MEAGLAELKFELERLKDMVDKLAISSRSTLEDEFSRAEELILDLHIAAEKTGNKTLEKLFAHIIELVLGNNGARVTLEIVSYRPTERSGIKSAKNHARHCLEFDLAKNHALKCLEEAIEGVDNIKRNLQ